MSCPLFCVLCLCLYYYCCTEWYVCAYKHAITPAVCVRVCACVFVYLVGPEGSGRGRPSLPSGAAGGGDAGANEVGGASADGGRQAEGVRARAQGKLFLFLLFYRTFSTVYGTSLPCTMSCPVLPCPVLSCHPPPPEFQRSRLNGWCLVKRFMSMVSVTLLCDTLDVLI